MKMISTTVLMLLFVGALANGKTIINVDVYYEVLCSDSVKFIRNQLEPSYKHFHDRLNISLIPYGKAKREFKQETGEWSFDCQHEEEECEANKEHACVFDAINKYQKPEDRQRLSVKFLGCVMAAKTPSDAGPYCAERVHLNESEFSHIDDCINGYLANELLAANGNKTDGVCGTGLSFVPTIVINKVYSPKIQTRAFNNFEKLICELLKCKNNKQRRTLANAKEMF